VTHQADVVVSHKGVARIGRGHPWVFRSDVVAGDDVGPGDVVRVFGPRDEPIGFAFYSDRSEIALRLIERGEELPETFLAARLDAALAWRQQIVDDAPAHRLVHGEGDGLPSLIVDRYGDYLVVQTLSQATERLKPEIVGMLVERLSPAGIIERNDPRVRDLEGLPRVVSVLHGEVPERVSVEENGVRFEVDLRRGQKTGLFLDQRENHRAARSYARGRVLDCFSYDGGFGLAVAAVADEVLAADVSAECVARIEANARNNSLGNVRTREANVFDLLRELGERGERFDTVILDPPAFAKSRSAIASAHRGYKDINLRALRLLEPGGSLITCSCSYHVDEVDFEGILASAAADVGASVAIVEKRRQARDHPVMLGVPETGYLKCFVLRRLG
jgi:23S rRNA (cytosine1962-C5)-methyltransferase